MMDFLLIPLVVGIITLGVYRLFELFVHRRERIMLVEKLGNLESKDLSEFLPTHLKLQEAQPPYPTSGALKAGCLLVGLGFGLLVAFVINTQYFAQSEPTWEARQLMGVVYAGSLLLFGGIGLIAAVLAEKRMANCKK